MSEIVNGMGKPVTPLVGADVFIQNEKGEVLLIRRSDNGLWATPGGCQDLGETPKQCAIRECKEESGFDIEIESLLGVYSSSCYEYVHYPYKDNEFCHLLFRARIIGGEEKISDETTEIGWFSEDELPELSDGHGIRIARGFKASKAPDLLAYFE